MTQHLGKQSYYSLIAFLYKSKVKSLRSKVECQRFSALPKVFSLLTLDLRPLELQSYFFYPEKAKDSRYFSEKRDEMRDESVTLPFVTTLSRHFLVCFQI